MRSQLAVRLGSLEPTIQHLPPDVHSLAAATEAIELADAYGICDGNPLAESQKITLRGACGTRADGSWAAATVADFGPRQGTGKNDKIAARELAGLMLFGEKLIIHTAHEFPTANESFLRLVSIFENYDDLRKKVARIRYANGEQGIELLSGQRLKYKARTGGGGRGFAKADLVVYDEAQHLQSEHAAASAPSKLANPNSQSWYAGSGGLSTSKMAWALRKKAILGSAGRMAYTEMSGEMFMVSEDGKIRFTAPDPADVAAWYRSMPGLGRWVTEEGMWALYEELGPELFARECLCVWDPLAGDEHTDPKIPGAAWAATAIDPSSAPPPVEGMTIAVDVAKDGEWSSIAVGIGSLADHYVEVIEHRAGTSWLPDRLVELVERWRPAGVGCNGAGPAGAQVGPILAAFTEAGLDADLLRQLNSREYQQACGGFYTAVTEFVDWPGAPARPRLRRTEQPALDDAVRGAGERPLGDAWVWDFRNATTPISPLVAVTIARALLPIEAPTVAPIFAF